MKVKSTIFFLLAAAAAFAQGSLNASAGYQFGRTVFGPAFVLDAKGFTWEAAILASTDRRIVGNVKASATLAQDGRSRLQLGARLASDVKTNRFKVSVVPEWNWRSRLVTASIGVDVHKKSGPEDVWPMKGGELTYTPTLSMQYLLYGKRYDPRPTPRKERSKCAKWFTAWDVVGYAAAGVGGYTMGLREAFHADPTIFERRWGKAPTSFWGSEGWRRKYHDNDPTKGKKSELLGNANRDFWHLADKVQRGGLVLGLTIPLIQTKRPLGARLANAGVSMLIYSFAYSRGYNFRYN
jgi:hypothetical protein